MLAMEQSQHFALIRQAQTCQHCADKAIHVLETHFPPGPGIRHSMQCTFCGKGNPIMRWRFQMKTSYHDHVAICKDCYATLRDGLLRQVPGIVGFLELEWNTGVAKAGKRLPYAMQTPVVIKKHVPRFHGMTGKIISFRGLVQPWYGYEVQFDAGGHHFFHERDLEFHPDASVQQQATPSPDAAAPPSGISAA
jgi:hypothetical protein